MDGAEAAGVAVVFAAGNEGSGAESHRTPADRITTDTNSYSVGALQPGSQNIASFSSRGPSGCDSQTIKPEICAKAIARLMGTQHSGTFAQFFHLARVGLA